MKLDRLTEIVCTNQSVNLSKFSRIKLPSIWTNPNHGRIGFIRSHISLPFCILWFQGFFFCSASKITIYVHCRWRRSWSSPRFSSGKISQALSVLLYFLWKRMMVKSEIKNLDLFSFDFWYLLMFGVCVNNRKSV